MTVLVTGATGFIGRALVERLLTSSGTTTVICLVKRDLGDPIGAVDTLRRLGARVIEGDLTHPAVCHEPPPRVDVVFHLAANIDTAARIADLRVNDQGTAHLLDWLDPVLDDVRVMFTSSVAVMDRAGPASGPLDESSPCTPRTEYGRSKLQGERILQARAATRNFTYTILRLGTIYGPGAKPGGLFDRLITLALVGSPLVRVNWPGRVSIMHVSDVVDLLTGLARHSAAVNETYCVANSDAPTITELAQRVGRACGRPLKVVSLPAWLWGAVQRLCWHPTVRFGATLIAARAFWRFTLLVDNAFWLNTSKLQSVWMESSVDVDLGLTNMVATILETITRL